jgi:hypothetical protein
METDPTGRCAKEPGAKLDEGKVRAGLMIEGFSRALWAVAEVVTYGAGKYSPRGWEKVPNAEERYFDAQMRHTLRESMGERNDKATGLSHAAHEAWNALARLELMLRKEEHENLQNIRHGVCGAKNVRVQPEQCDSESVQESEEDKDPVRPHLGFAFNITDRADGIPTCEMEEPPQCAAVWPDKESAGFRRHSIYRGPLNSF